MLFYSDTFFLIQLHSENGKYNSTPKKLPLDGRWPRGFWHDDDVAKQRNVFTAITWKKFKYSCEGDNIDGVVFYQDRRGLWGSFGHHFWQFFLYWYFWKYDTLKVLHQFLRIIERKSWQRMKSSPRMILFEFNWIMTSDKYLLIIITSIIKFKDTCSALLERN